MIELESLYEYTALDLLLAFPLSNALAVPVLVRVCGANRFCLSLVCLSCLCVWVVVLFLIGFYCPHNFKFDPYFTGVLEGVFNMIEVFWGGLNTIHIALLVLGLPQVHERG